MQMTLCVVRKALIWLSISVACEGQPESRWVRGVQKNFFPEIISSGRGAGILIWEFANRGGELILFGLFQGQRGSGKAKG